MKHRLLLINILIICLALLNVVYISNKSKKYIYDYSSLVASKITKYIVNNAKIKEKIDLSAKNIYKVEKNGENENIIYNAQEINYLIDTIGKKIYSIFSSIEKSDLESMNINANILSNKKKNGLVLEIPTSLIFNNYLFSSIGPKIPISIVLTGEFESFISSDISEYGINNALITLYINIKVAEQVVLPFLTKKIITENKIPIYMSLVNGKIPKYYIDNFTKKT